MTLHMNDGAGVSGSAFAANTAFRNYTFETFGARVPNMESAARLRAPHRRRMMRIANRTGRLRA